MELPDPELKSLSEIEKSIQDAFRVLGGREQFARFVVETGYIDKLLPLFETLEDLESMEDLFLLSSIMQYIIFLNDQAIYDLILSDKAFPVIIGILEYDKEFPLLKGNHRDHFKNSAKFKEVKRNYSRSLDWCVFTCLLL